MNKRQETRSVTAPYLLEGAVYALEQGGLLLHDAISLYRNGSNASAVVLATFAREEFGRWRILLKLRKEVLGGKQLSLKELRARCGKHDHMVRQRAGSLVVSSRDRPEAAAMGKAVQKMGNAVEGSTEWQAAKDEYERLLVQIKQRIPADRHTNRMSALYVDPISVTEWNRPTKKITREVCSCLLFDVLGEYYLEQNHGYADLSIVATKDAELAEALKNWTDRPTMPAQEVPIP
jgi:AbiV family abortive infection protein